MYYMNKRKIFSLSDIRTQRIFRNTMSYSIFYCTFSSQKVDHQEFNELPRDCQRQPFYRSLVFVLSSHALTTYLLVSKIIPWLEDVLFIFSCRPPYYTKCEPLVLHQSTSGKLEFNEILLQFSRRYCTTLAKRKTDTASYSIISNSFFIFTFLRLISKRKSYRNI